MKKILFFFNELKATFWFIPVLIILSSIFLAFGLVSLDQVLTLTQDGLGRFFFVNSADSARSILSTISGAMIGVAGTVFSVTLVALTLASSQFGPRLIKNFMYVRLNQVVLGSYVSTYLYCIFVLNAIKESDEYTFMPVLSILFALISAFVNIILLIIFIHRIAISIQADKVISDISELIYHQLKTLFPPKNYDLWEGEKSFNIEKIKSRYPHVVSIKSKKNGYVQYIDFDTILEKAASFDGLIELYIRPGDHLVQNLEIGKIYTKNDLEDKELSSIYTQFVIGKTKIAQQDLEFSIDQMVEIAVRALSPGINDPYTAIACIDNLTATMCHLSQIRFPSTYKMDDQNKVRIVADTWDFEGLMNASFNQIRQFSTGNTAVIIRLMEGLITINSFVEKDNYKQSIMKHAKMVLNLGKTTITEENDLHDLMERSKLIL
jgi:uncharacterized membrane protein